MLIFGLMQVLFLKTEFAQARLNCDARVIKRNAFTVATLYTPLYANMFRQVAAQAGIKLELVDIALVGTDIGTNVHRAEGATVKLRVRALTTNGTWLRLSNGTYGSYDEKLNYVSIWLVSSEFRSVNGSEGNQLGCVVSPNTGISHSLINEGNGAKFFESDLRFRDDDFLLSVR